MIWFNRRMICPDVAISVAWGRAGTMGSAEMSAGDSAKSNELHSISSWFVIFASMYAIK